MNRADARARQHGDCRLGCCRQINDDAIAFSNLVSLKDIGEAADFAMQLLVSKSAFLARLAFPNNSRFISSWTGKMTVQAVFREIQLTANKPFCKGCFPIEHFLPRLMPNEFPGFTRPKSVGASNRFAIHFSVLREGFDPRAFGELAGRLEDALLDQVRFDVLVHSNFLISLAHAGGKRREEALKRE